jgi:hypothetical protein
MSNNNLVQSTSLDRLPRYLENETPGMLRAKESQDYSNVTSTYWLSYWGKINLQHNYDLLIKNKELLKLSYLPSIIEYAEYDFMN